MNTKWISEQNKIVDVKKVDRVIYPRVPLRLKQTPIINSTKNKAKYGAITWHSKSENVCDRGIRGQHRSQTSASGDEIVRRYIFKRNFTKQLSNRNSWDTLSGLQTVPKLIRKREEE